MALTFGALLEALIKRGVRAVGPALPWRYGELASELGVDLKTLYQWRKDRERPNDLRGLLRVLFGDTMTPDREALQSAWRLAQGVPPETRAPTSNVPEPGLCLGRETEIQTLVGALSSRPGACAIVLGGPGFGKSTVTKVAARSGSVAELYGQRRWFIALETALSAEDILSQIASTVGAANDERDGLIAYLASEASLLILDNLESSWWEDRKGVEALLREMGGVANLGILASIRGDETIDGPSWDLQAWLKPLKATAATEVFLRIAGRIAPDDSCLPYFLAETTGVLGGIPLAIRLMAIIAGRDGSLDQLKADWEEAGVDLAARTDAPNGRQDSLVQSIAVSVASSRLKRDGRSLLAVLGAAPAGLARDDGIAIFGPRWRVGLAQLRAVGLAEGSTRIDLLPPVRDFVRRYVELEPTAAAAWREHFLNLVWAEGARIGEVDGADVLARLLPEVPNIEAALDAAGQAGQVPNATGVASGLADTIRFGGLRDTRTLDRLADNCEFNQDRFGAAGAFFAAGLVLLNRADYDGAQARTVRALEIYRSLSHGLGQANALKSLAEIDFNLRHWASARAQADEALDLYSNEENALGQANCLFLLARLARVERKFDIEESLSLQARELYSAAGGVVGEANVLLTLGDAAFENDLYEDAIAHYRSALEQFSVSGDLLGEANCNFRIADACAQNGDTSNAYECVDRALEAFRTLADIDTEDGEARCLDLLGDLALQREAYDDATAYFERSAHLYLSAGNALGAGHCERGIGLIAAAQGHRQQALDHYRAALEFYALADDNDYDAGKTHALIAEIELGEARDRHIDRARWHWTAAGRPALLHKLDEMFANQ